MCIRDRYSWTAATCTNDIPQSTPGVEPSRYVIVCVPPGPGARHRSVRLGHDPPVDRTAEEAGNAWCRATRVTSWCGALWARTGCVSGTIASLPADDRRHPCGRSAAGPRARDAQEPGQRSPDAAPVSYTHL